MKRRVSIRVDVELDATNPTGIDLAAEDALAQLQVNSVIDAGSGHYHSARLVDKKFMMQDEQVLLELVLQATGVSEEKFLNGRNYQATHARFIFTHLANKYLEWDYSQIGRYMKRHYSAVAKAAQAMSKESYRKRTKGIMDAMNKIQYSWSRLKE